MDQMNRLRGGVPILLAFTEEESCTYDILSAEVDGPNNTIRVLIEGKEKYVYVARFDGPGWHNLGDNDWRKVGGQDEPTS